MAKAPLICKKLSAGSSAEAIGKELDRRAHVYENNVDPTRTHLNLDYVRQQDGRMVPVPHAQAEAAGYEHLEDAIERRMGELRTKRKIRSDAVKAEGMVISTEGALPDEDATAFLTEAIDWMQDRYGKENLLAAGIHMDEDVPHAQLWIAPVIHDEATGYDRLSAKELFTPNKVDKKTKKVLEEGTLGRLQREFYEQVAKKHGFERPFTSEQRYANGIEYKSQAAYKAGRQEEQHKQRSERLRRRNQERSREVAKAQAEQRRAAEENRRLAEQLAELERERRKEERRAAEENRQLEQQLKEVEQREHAARERNRGLAAERDRLVERVGGLDQRAGWLARQVENLREGLGRVRDRLYAARDAIWWGIATLRDQRRTVRRMDAPELAELAEEMGFSEVVAEEAPAPRSAMAAAEWARETQRPTPARDDPER